MKKIYVDLVTTQRLLITADDRCELDVTQVIEDWVDKSGEPLPPQLLSEVRRHHQRHQYSDLAFSDIDVEVLEESYEHEVTDSK
jgi:hypothetical protein